MGTAFDIECGVIQFLFICYVKLSDLWALYWFYAAILVRIMTDLYNIVVK